MARYNEILVGRFNRMLQKLLSMKGPASLISLSDELYPTLPFLNGVENRYLEGFDRYSTFGLVAAGGAGNFAVWQFRNPAGSNVVAVVEKLLITGDATSDQYKVAYFIQTTTDLTTIQSGSVLDSRGRTGSTVVISMKNNSAATFLGGLIQQPVFAAINFDLVLTDDTEIAVPPGTGINIQRGTANNGLQVGVIWRERFFEDSERA